MAIAPTVGTAGSCLVRAVVPPSDIECGRCGARFNVAARLGTHRFVMASHRKESDRRRKLVMHELDHDCSEAHARLSKYGKLSRRWSSRECGGCWAPGVGRAHERTTMVTYAQAGPRSDRQLARASGRADSQTQEISTSTGRSRRRGLTVAGRHRAKHTRSAGSYSGPRGGCCHQHRMRRVTFPPFKNQAGASHD